MVVLPMARLVSIITRPHHVLAALLWILFLGLSTVEWLEFRDEPTYSTVQLERSEMPSFTVCPALYSNHSLTMWSLATYKPFLEKYIDHEQYKNLTYRKAYVDYGLSLKKMIRRGPNNVNSSREHDVVYKTKIGQWRRTFYFAGMCHTYEPMGNQYNKQNPYLGPVLRLWSHPEFTQTVTKRTYSLQFHGNDGPAKSHHFHFHKDLPKVYVHDGDTILVSIKISRYTSPNLRRKPCNDTPGYTLSGCLGNCTFTSRLQKLGCAMPWMDVPAQPCVIPNKRKAKSMRRVLVVPKRCQARCLPACVDDRIEVMVGKGTLTTKPGLATVLIKFGYLVDNRVTVLAYSPGDLLGNVGGLMGLLLGSSILSLTATGASLLRGLYRRRRATTAPPSPQLQGGRILRM